MPGKRVSFSLWLLGLLAVLATFVRPAMARDYVITSGDSINIKVVGEADLTKSYTVNDEGKIFVPMIQNVTATGKTATELEEELTKRLKEYIKNPVVTVEITSPTNTSVWVTGEVKTPGEVKVKPDARFMDLIQKAGGLTDNADRSRAVLQRRGEANTRTIDLKALYNGDLSKNELVEVGDTLYVPAKAQGKIKIQGEVSTPGDKDLKQDMTPMEAIQAAGGFKDTADKTVVVLRHKDNSEMVLDMDAESKGDENAVTKTVRLQEDDTLIVSNNKNAQITVRGSVHTPMVFAFEPGMTVMDAVTKAGSFADDADKNEVRIVHKDGTEHAAVDLDRYLNEGDTEQNAPLQKGDTIIVSNNKLSQFTVNGTGVTKPGTYTYEPGMTVMDAINKAGSFTDTARKANVNLVHKAGTPQKVDLAKYLDKGDAAQNVPIQKGDTIIVGSDQPKGPKNGNSAMNTVLNTALSVIPSIFLYRIIR